jgi:hypothetical protein
MQQSERLDAYLGWLKERGIRYPVRRPARTSTAKPTAVAFISATPLAPEERALLDKMVAAMRLPPDLALVRCGELQQEDPPLALAIVLGAPPATPLACPTINTLHPGILLRDPTQKRQAWTDLQAAMALLGRA